MGVMNVISGSVYLFIRDDYMAEPKDARGFDKQDPIFLVPEDIHRVQI